VLTSVSKTLRILMALGAFFVVAIGVAACGGDDDEGVPSNAVATVDGDPITKADFERWLEINARQSASATGGEALIPDPPDYENCIAVVRRQLARIRGQARQTDAQLRTQCRTLDTQLNQQTMALLIQSDWIEREADDLGVEVTDAQIDRALAETKRQSFPTARAYERFLRDSGMTERDIVFRLRIRELSDGITEKIQRSAGDVTDAQISAYYNRNREQFAVPERRDLEIILTRTEGEAQDAKATIENGTSWAEAAREFSTDALSKGNGGRLAGVARGQQDRALDEAAFNAREDVIVGPVRGQFGWYIVRVTGVTPAKQNSLEQSREQIRRLLEEQGGTEKLNTFARDFQERWTGKTDCRRGYVIPICDNAPRRTTSTAGGTVATAPADQR
jgi:foldase protein PrsA